MKTILIFSFLFSVIYNYNIYGQSNTRTKQKYEYLLYLPKDYSSNNENYPLVISLHGASLRGNDLNKIKSYGLPYLIEKGYTYDFIIASPQCPAKKNWGTDIWFDTLYSELISKYRIDTNRIYIIGMSLGGCGTWQLGMNYPNRFAAMVPMCGGYAYPDKVCLISHIPIWTFHGAKDIIVNISETEKLVKKLEDCDGNIKYTRLESKGHDLTYLFEDEEIYKWMLKQKK